MFSIITVATHFQILYFIMGSGGEEAGFRKCQLVSIISYDHNCLFL